MRHWLITWTAYGTWLPGARAGFVSKIRDEQGKQVIHNVPGTPFDADMPELEAAARAQMKGSPVHLDKSAAEALIQQYQETARIRGWELEDASVMDNHTHIVVSVPDDPDPQSILDPDPQSILETFKSWATRAVKKLRPLPPNGTFWTEKGSKRKLPDDAALRNAVIYVVRKQPDPLATYYAPKWQSVLDEYDRANPSPNASASRTP